MMELFEPLMSAEGLIALVTLIFLEVVLGIDNLVFISILTSRLPEEKKKSTRRLGVMMALLFRIILLMAISWIAKLTTPLFTIAEHPVSGRDLILFLGGLFLLAKSTTEIHHKTQPEHPEAGGKRKVHSVAFTIVQIGLLDIIFSLDSVITAVGMSNDLVIMVTAVVVSMIVMLLAVNGLSKFIEANPTVQVLALSFLILIGAVLIAESLHFEIPKGYIYFSIAFSLGVEFINMRVRRLGGR
jgi:predicted tellurium resistance membrane protein TerC